MRRSFILLSALGLLSGVVGCHVAGVCDCDNHVPCCLGCGHPAEHGDVITPVAGSSTEFIPEMPRPVGGTTPKAK